MKICWDNLEKLVYRPDRGEWQDKKWKNTFYIYKDVCETCEDPFLTYKGKKGIFCSKSCAQIGENNPQYNKKRSEKHRKGLSESNKDKIISEKTKKKISKALIGKTPSEKTRKKLSEAKIGENHWNWQGGISCEPYCGSWLDKEFKMDIKDIDNNVCQSCGITRMISLKVFSENLSIHHINYDKKDCKPFNLVTLCRSCNSKANYNRDYWQTYYIKIKQKEI